MKNLLKLLGAAALLGVMFSLVQAAQTCQRTDFFCYESGPTGNLLTPARLDANGNLTILGNESVSGTSSVTGSNTVGGISVYTPVNQNINATSTPISATSSTMLIISTAALNYSSSVAIATSTAINGQYFMVSSTSSANSVQITTGTSVGVIGDDAVIVISSSKSAVGFLYNSTLSQWIEVGRQ